MGEVKPARRTRTHLAAAWGLTILILAVLAADLVFVSLNASRTGTSKAGLDAFLVAAVLLYAGSGYLIASRRPDNAIGWLLGSIGLMLPAVPVSRTSASARSATRRRRCRRRAGRPPGAGW